MANFVELRAFVVHIVTASGAALALLALILATGGYWEGMFLCLGLAMLVDGVDGPLARKFKVAEVLPRWSGETLDLVVDFVTYVFVPAFAIAVSGILPHDLAIVAGMVIVITGALYFADRDMKTTDNYFRGFPAVWNLAAFYLYLFYPRPWWIAAIIIGVLAALTFVPVHFVHPLRVKRLYVLNIVLMVAWVLLALLALIQNFEPGIYAKWALAAIAGYFLVAGFWRRPA